MIGYFIGSLWLTDDITMLDMMLTDSWCALMIAYITMITKETNLLLSTATREIGFKSIDAMINAWKLIMDDWLFFKAPHQQVV